MKNNVLQHGIRRNGISLLEILISIGIVTIGLVGVASMIPAAHFKAAQGVRRDRISSMGQRAMDDFLIRGFTDPGTGGIAPNPKWVTYINRIPNFGMYGTDGQLIRGAYCFDPYSIAWRLNNPRQGNEPVAYPDQFDPSPRFPPFPGNFNEHLNFGIPRVCPNNRLLTEFAWNLNDAIYNEEAILASWESMFTLKDDMAFQMPAKTSDPRTQEYYGSANMFRAKRLNNGEYSWMATLSPEGEFGTRWDPVNSRYRPVYLTRAAHRYNLSILVFNRRVFDRLKPNQEIFGLVPDVPNTPLNESITLPTNQTTFDILVDPPTEFQNPDLGATFADVGSGKWVGLMQQVGGVAILKWFKVLSSIDQSNGAGTRFQMTLTGQAWNMPHVPNPNNVFQSHPDMPRPSQIFVIYLNQVVGVQERSIELYAN